MKVTMLAGDKVLQLQSARIPAQSARRFRDAAELFEEAQALQRGSAELSRRAREEGYEAGRAEALAEMREALALATDSLRRDMAEEDRRRERQAVEAAMQAVELLIGRREDAEIATGLVRQALVRAGASEVEVIVSPDVAEQVARSLEGKDSVSVVADAALAPMQCRIVVGDGRIIADLDTQLAALRRRWGLADTRNG
ncbi:FliH/SctL family protein [Altererythrobacter sp. CAU 1778]